MAKDQNGNIREVEFKRNGIFLKYGRRDLQRIGDPIHVWALGKGLQDGLAYTMLELRDRDEQWRDTVVRSSLLTASTKEFKEHLTDVCNYRLPLRQYTGMVIDALAAENPEERIDITAVPGWHGRSFLHPRKVIKPKGDESDCQFTDDPNVLLGEFLCKGTLKQWQQHVARHCRLSSRLRLAIGVPFAATVLRRLRIDTFGCHLVGTTSSGKTFCLRVAGSVPGFNTEAGVTTWDGTPTGLEQVALGRRDNVLLLDETSLVEGDEKKTADFLRLSAYRFAKNRQKHRAGHYARKHTVDTDLRNILLSSGEEFLPIRRRLSGQDVRLIQIPVCVSEFDDIFDAENSSDIVGKTISQREKFVNGCEASSRQFQGIALVEFVTKFINDSDADAKLKAAVDEFISKSPIPDSQSRKAFARIRRRIAAIYAGMALAIDYDILPFSKEATLRDLRKCLNDAIGLLLTHGVVQASTEHDSDDVLIAEFRKKLRSAKFVIAGAHADRTKPLTGEQIKAADGYINYVEPNGPRLMLQTRLMRTWYPDEAKRNRLVSLLRNILAGRQSDTCSRQVSLKPVSAEDCGLLAVAQDARAYKKRASGRLAEPFKCGEKIVGYRLLAQPVNAHTLNLLARRRLSGGPLCSDLIGTRLPCTLWMGSKDRCWSPA